MGRKAEDLSGQKFGKLKAIFMHPYKSNCGRVRWVCICSCGNYKTVTAHSLKRGEIKSCGCGKIKKYHYQSFGPTHRSWHGMRTRCLNPKVYEYKNYGGRGITVCERWKYFKNFFEDMGPRPDGYSLERIDVNGNYEPSNCKWIPIESQRYNLRAKGYRWRKDRKKYEAYIKRKKKTFHLGVFDYPDEAKLAYESAKSEFNNFGTIKGVRI